MSDKRTTDRRSFLTGVGALGLGGVLSACVGPSIRTSGSPTGGGSTAGAKLLPAADSAPATGTVSFAHWRAEDKAVFDTLELAYQLFPDAGSWKLTDLIRFVFGRDHA